MVKDHRFSVAICHRRMGKTTCAINQLIHSALQNEKPNPRYCYIAPTFTQAKRIAWDILLDYTRPLGGVANVSELRVDFMGRRISLYGADNPDSLRGIYSDGTCIDEYGDCVPSLFTEVIRPALSDRLGFCLFLGTPKGDNHFKDLRDYAEDEKNGWGISQFKASETGLIPDEELRDAKRTMGDRYEQEYEVSFDAPIIGSYYAKIINELEEKNHIREIPSENATRKFTAFDLGISDSTSIWVCEAIGGEYRLMDYYENHGQSLDHYVGWLKENGYEDYHHIMPHDIQVRELGTGKSRLELLQTAGLDISIAPKLPVEEGIQAVRQILPNCWFNKDKTKYGLECMKNYRRQWNEKLNVFTTSPLHDWSSHCADAFRYLAVGIGVQSKASDWSRPIDDSYKSAYI